MFKAISVCLVLSFFHASAIANFVSLNSQSNLFRASDFGMGGGLIPFAIELDSDRLTAFEFSSVTGTTNCCASNTRTLSNADGLGAGNNTNINSSGGISGIVSPGGLFLAGVFTSSFDPASDIAPERLNFFDIGTNFNQLSPLLNQSFFIGDGRTGFQSGDIQRFVAPLGADTLHLGFVDASFFTGNPGGFSDNSGNLNINYTQRTTNVTEPSLCFC